MLLSQKRFIKIKSSTWCCKTDEKTKHPFKLLTGDLLSHYPYGKIFTIENLEEESQNFMKEIEFQQDF